MSKDPIGYHSSDANDYRYLENSPLTLTDPSGNRGFIAIYIYVRIAISGLVGEILAICTSEPQWCGLQPKPKPIPAPKPPFPAPSCDPEYQSCPPLIPQPNKCEN